MREYSNNISGCLYHTARLDCSLQQYINYTHWEKDSMVLKIPEAAWVLVHFKVFWHKTSKISSACEMINHLQGCSTSFVWQLIAESVILADITVTDEAQFLLYKNI